MTRKHAIEQLIEIAEAWAKVRQQNYSVFFDIPVSADMPNDKLKEVVRAYYENSGTSWSQRAIERDLKKVRNTLRAIEIARDLVV